MKKTRPTTASDPLTGGEKVRTSIYFSLSLYNQARRAARELNLSFNAYLNMVLSRATTAPTSDPTLAHGWPWPHGSAVAMMRKPAPPSAPDLSKYGEGYTVPGEFGEPDFFASWDKIEDYVLAQRADPTADWRTLGPRLGLSQEEARAADTGQESPEFERYMTAKYGPPKTVVDPKPTRPARIKKGRR